MGDDSNGGFSREGQFLVHFYLDDGSHQMDASVLHACEGHVLDLFHEVGKLLDVDFRIETRAHPEGGLQVWLTLIGKHAIALTFIATSVGAVLASGKWLIYDRPLTLQQQELNDLTLRKMRLELKKMEAEAETKAPATEATKPLDLEPPPAIGDVLPALEDKRKIVRLRSKFYEKLLEEQRAHAVGFAPLHLPFSNDETVVRRDQFASFVLDPIDVRPQTYKKVEVEVVSPVLTRKALKWRGIFEKEVVSFEITDTDFLSRVANKKVVFQNGTTLICDLIVSFKENEVGDIVPQAYEAEKIHKHFVKTAQRRGAALRANGRRSKHYQADEQPEDENPAQIKLPLTPEAQHKGDLSEPGVLTAQQKL